MWKKRKALKNKRLLYRAQDYCNQGETLNSTLRKQKSGKNIKATSVRMQGSVWTGFRDTSPPSRRAVTGKRELLFC